MNHVMKKIIQKLEFDETTGLPFAEDLRGNLYPIDWKTTANALDSPRVYLQSELRNITWASETDWNRIPDSLHPGNFLIYTVPTDSKFHISFLLAAASRRSGDDRINTIGLFTGGQLRAVAPFFNEIAYTLFSPITLVGGTVVELKFKPGHKKVEMGVNCGGYLTNE